MNLFNLLRGEGVLNYLLKKCARNKRGNLCFQDFSYIWNEPIFLDSSFKIFCLFFSNFSLLCDFFLTNFENDIFHEIPAAVAAAAAAAAAARNPSRRSGYAVYLQI